MRNIKLVTAQLALISLALAGSSQVQARGRGPLLPIYLFSGHYEGSLLTHQGDGSTSQVPVSADSASDRYTAFKVTVKDMAGTERLGLVSTSVEARSAVIAASVGVTGSMPLDLQPDGQCLASRGEMNISLCITGEQLNFQVTKTDGNVVLFSLTLHRFVPGTASPAQETPQTFTLTQAVERARTRSFASRIEFEHMVQAKAQAKAAYLNLLPRINLGTIVNNWTPTFPSILGAIGDLAPFLLPSRWFQARQAAEMSKAEHDTDILMRLNMGAQVEGLFYAYARDLKSRDLTRDILVRVTGIRNEVKIRETWGQLPDGSTANLNSIINQIQQTFAILGDVVTEDLGAISQTLGFFDPNTVMDATIDAESIPIDNAPSVDYASINAATLS